MEGGVTYFALRCFSCQMFKVNRKTKLGKWKCTVCGEGQSVVKVWGRGDRAKDVRGLVMELNAAAGRGEDLTPTLRRAATVAAASTSLPPPHQARDSHDDATPVAPTRRRDPHGRGTALLMGSGTALQPQRFAGGMAEPPRFTKGMTEAEPVGNKHARFDEPVPLGFTSGRDISRLDSSGARPGEMHHGGSMGEHVWHEHEQRRNAYYADDVLPGATAGGDSRSCGSVGADDSCREKESPRQSAMEPTHRGSKASRWGAFASPRGGVNSVEQRRGQTEFGRETEGDPNFVTSLPETTAPSTQPRGSSKGTRKRALPSTSAARSRRGPPETASARSTWSSKDREMGRAIDPPRSRGAREKTSGRHEGQTYAAYGRVPLAGQASVELLGGVQQQQQEQTGWDSLGTGLGEVDDVCGGRRGGAGGSSGASSSSRVVVGELDKNAYNSGPSRGVGRTYSAGVDGGTAKGKTSRWSNFA